MDLYFQAWKKFATFKGRATRTEYWTFVLVNFCISFLLVILSSVLGFTIDENGYTPLTFVFTILSIIPTISVCIRRLHDINLSGWWGWLFIPLGFPMLIVGFIGSKEEENNTNEPSLAKAVINHSKELVQEVKPTINNYIQKHNKTDEIAIKNNPKIEDNMISEDINEDEIYEQVMLEIEKDDKVKSTWAKALAQSDGDDKKAQSLYIKSRVEFLVQEEKVFIENKIKMNNEKQENILKPEQKKDEINVEKVKNDKSDLIIIVSFVIFYLIYEVIKRFLY